MENFVPSSRLPESQTGVPKVVDPKMKNTKSVEQSKSKSDAISGGADLPNDSVSDPPPVAVLSERNVEKNVAINGNKMMSPVLLKLRRNQERRVTPANPMNPVQVPSKKISGFPAPDRYMSPTDSLMSPISRGLLARSRRAAVRPTPAYVPPKVLENTFLDAEVADSTS